MSRTTLAGLVVGLDLVRDLPVQALQLLLFVVLILLPLVAFLGAHLEALIEGLELLVERFDLIFIASVLRGVALNLQLDLRDLVGGALSSIERFCEELHFLGENLGKFVVDFSQSLVAR